MRRKSVRIGACFLALTLAAGVVPWPGQGMEEVKAETAGNVNDLLQIRTGDGTSVDMQLYANGVYEGEIDLSAGSHTLTLYRNGEEGGLTDEVTVSEDQTVYVRYQNGELINSVDNADRYHTAALTGNFFGLEFVDEEGNDYSIASWDPADANAELDYAGGGLYTRTFEFKELAEDVTIQDGGYKVAFDDAWDYSLGNGDSNIELTVPAGTDSLTVFVDELNGQVYDSVRTEPLDIYQNSGNVSSPAFATTVSLIGTVRQNDADNWTADAKGYEFTQISDTLYLYQQVFNAGSYEYKAVFNYANWYESNGGGNKALTVSEDGTNVVFLYDVETDKLYDTCNDYNIVAEMLGFAATPAEAEVRNNANGTTTFVMTGAEGDDVKLYYADRETPDAVTEVQMTAGTDSNGNFNSSFVSEDIFFGDDAVDVIFYYMVNGTRVLDPSSEEVEAGGETWSAYTRDAFTGRLVCVPGTFPGPSWDEASNEMTYEGNGLYSYTFEDVPAANYEYKIAMGSWTENYGVGGAQDGSNYSLSVTEKGDVTVYYSDFSHLAVTSLDYIFADITLSGTGIPEGTKLTDSGLTGIYSASVALTAGTYSDLKLTCDGETYEISEFTLENDKTVTFYFDPVTKIYYNNASDEVLDEASIYFDSKDEEYKDIYGAVPTNTDVTFSLDTGVDAQQVKLVIKGKEQQVLEMEKTDASEDGKARWTVTTQFSQLGGYEYYFVIAGESSVKIYCDDDGYYGTGTTADLTQVKPYEMNVYEEGYETPDWMKNAVVYQIFPDRFFNGDTSNDTAQTTSRGATDYEYITEWYTWPENPEQETLNPDTYPEEAWSGDGEWSNEIYGGDLKGITERIDYLKALGVNVIYLNPVFQSISSHRYDATDYTQIDPILGTLGDFTELVEVAEANDMHIVLDGVFNHVSDDSIYFDRYYKFVGQDGKVGAYPYWAYVYDYMAENEGAAQEEAEAAAREYFEGRGVTDFTYTEWFVVSSDYMTDDNGEYVQDTIGERAGENVYSYEGWWGYDSMPVIASTDGSEYQTPGWADEIINGEDSVTQYWLSQGSNGWRLDVANEVSDETWQKFRESVKSLDSDAVIIGEIWDDASEYLLGDMYDSVMNYVFRDAVLAYAKGGSAQDAVNELEKMRERYPEEAFYAMMNLVGSHDTTRLLSYLDGIDDDRAQTDTASAFPTYETTSDLAKERQYLVAFIQMTYPGAPTIYYGDELGMVGADDPDDRRAMEWGKGNQELTEWYATMAEIRNSYSALRTGDIEPVDTGDSDTIMAYVRSDEESTLYVAANNDTENVQQVTFAAEAGKSYTDLVSGETYTADAEGTLTADVPALSGVILTDEVKDIEINSEELAPAYDESYVVTDENTDEPGTDVPGTDEPGTDEPGTDVPGTDEPGTDEPGTDTPGTDKPASDNPTAENPTADNGGDQSGQNGSADAGKQTVKTGDSANIMLPATAMLISALVAAGIFMAGKRYGTHRRR